MSDISAEAREAAECERAEFFKPAVPGCAPKGYHVQQLLNTIEQRHKEEGAQLQWWKSQFCEHHREDESWTQYGCPVCSAGRYDAECVRLTRDFAEVTTERDSLRSQLREREAEVARLKEELRSWREDCCCTMKKDSERLTREREMMREHHLKSLESDSEFGSCDCDTKTPDIQYHKAGCKYRLIVQRDSLKADSERLTRTHEEAVRRLALRGEIYDHAKVSAERDSLQRRVDSLETALRPFALLSECFLEWKDNPQIVAESHGVVLNGEGKPGPRTITFGDLFSAAEALNPSKQ